MTISVRHTGIVVQNLEEALVFWRDLLGFSVTRAMNEAGPFIDAMMGLQNTKVTTVKMSAPLGGGVELRTQTFRVGAALHIQLVIRT